MQTKIQAAISEIAMVVALFIVGVLFGVGQLLSAGKPATAGMVVGHAICMGALTMAAGAVLVWVPDVPLVGLFGLAGMLASLGTKGLERLFSRILGGERP